VAAKKAMTAVADEMFLHVVVLVQWMMIHKESYHLKVEGHPMAAAEAE
jgi:hypothetical protein